MAKTHHQHGGKSSESLLDKEIILKELNICYGQRIIDAGCGDGYMSKEFSRLVGAAGKVYSIDPHKELIKKLKQEVHGSNIEPIGADITKPVSIDSASVDLIYLSTVLHGFSKTQVKDFCKEVKRLLKRRGVLAIVEIKKQETPFGPLVEIRYSPEEMKRALDLAVKNLIDIGEYFYMQTFENV